MSAARSLQRMRRRVVVGILVGVVLIGATGCQVARAGTRCRTVDWGRDSTHVMQCRDGRWTRVMTIRQAAAAIAKVVAAKRAATTTTAVPEPQGGRSLPLGPGAAFEVTYVVASDQDVDPVMVDAVRHELGLVSDWFASQTAGRRPRLVRDASGQIIVTTVRLGRTRSELEAAPSPAATLQADLAAIGIPAPNHRSVVYVDSGGDACGATLPSGTISALFLAECSTYPSVESTWRFGASYLAAHEMTHAFGAVEDCAPHTTFDGHVGDDPRDILYSGPEDRDWTDLLLDPGHDDYYSTGRSDCWDIANSTLWEGP